MGADRRVSLYFLAGIGTWRSGCMFHDAMKQLSERFAQSGYEVVHIKDLYPFGCMDGLNANEARRKLWKQIYHAGLEFLFPFRISPCTKATALAIREDYRRKAGGRLILIGHSGGGLVAYQTAKLLEREGCPVERVVMVGSPSPPIGKSWRNRVHSIVKAGWIGDWITWWKFPFLGPRLTAKLPIEGGHPFYFCLDKMDAAGTPNLHHVVDTIWNWASSGQQRAETDTSCQVIAGDV
jgi:pimeloyl-ACP methyl ester carboxylesterase